MDSSKNESNESVANNKTTGNKEINFCENSCAIDGKECINEFKCENSSVYPSYHFDGVYFTKMEWIQAYKRRCKSQLKQTLANPDSGSDDLDDLINQPKTNTYCSPNNDLINVYKDDNNTTAEDQHCATMDLYCKIDEETKKCVTREENEVFCDKLLSKDDTTLNKDQVNYMYKLYELGAISNLKACLKSKGDESKQTWFQGATSFLDKEIKEEYTLIESADFQKIMDNIDKININGTELQLIDMLEKQLELKQTELNILDGLRKDGLRKDGLEKDIEKIKSVLESDAIKNYKPISLFDSLKNLLIARPMTRNPFISILDKCNLMKKVRMRECVELNKKKDTTSQVDCEKQTKIGYDDYKNYRPTRFEIAYIILRLFHKFMNNQPIEKREQPIFVFLFDNVYKESTYIENIKEYFTSTREEKYARTISSKIDSYIKGLDINDYIARDITGSSLNKGDEVIFNSIFIILNSGKKLDIDDHWYSNFSLDKSYSIPKLSSKYFDSLLFSLDLSHDEKGSTTKLRLLPQSYISSTISLFESSSVVIFKIYQLVMKLWYNVKQLQPLMILVLGIIKDSTFMTVFLAYAFNSVGLGDYLPYVADALNMIHDCLCLFKSLTESSADTLTLGYSVWGDKFFAFKCAISIANSWDTLINICEWFTRPLSQVMKNNTIKKNKEKVSNEIVDANTSKIDAVTFSSEANNNKDNKDNDSKDKLYFIKQINPYIQKIVEICGGFLSVNSNIINKIKKILSDNTVEKTQLYYNLFYIIIIIVLTQYFSHKVSCTAGKRTAAQHAKDRLEGITTFPVQVSTYLLKCNQINNDYKCEYFENVKRTEDLLNQLGITNDSIRDLYKASTKTFDEVLKIVINNFRSIFTLHFSKFDLGIKRFFESSKDIPYKICNFFYNFIMLIKSYSVQGEKKKTDFFPWLYDGLHWIIQQSNDDAWLDGSIVGQLLPYQYVHIPGVGERSNSFWSLFVEHCDENGINPYGPQALLWYYSEYFIQKAGYRINRFGEMGNEVQNGFNYIYVGVGNVYAGIKDFVTTNPFQIKGGKYKSKTKKKKMTIKKKSRTKRREKRHYKTIKKHKRKQIKKTIKSTKQKK